MSAQLYRTLPVLLGGDSESVESFLLSAVPDPADRFNFDQLNRPLERLVSPDREALEGQVEETSSQRLERAGDSWYSLDQAVLVTLLRSYFRVHELAEAGRFSVAELRENIDRSLHRLFSYIASGPPPLRVEQLLALHRAGVLRFLGPDLKVSVEDDLFSARSPALPGSVLRAPALIDAYFADDVASAVDHELLQRLLNSGDVTVESCNGLVKGKFMVDIVGRPVRVDGSVHRFRYLLGSMVSGGGSEAPFSRPGSNARGFRGADQLARLLLDAVKTPHTHIGLATASRHPG